MENFHNGCCHPWTKNPFKNSCSRQLRIVNAGYVDCQQVGSIDRNLFFAKLKLLIFEKMITTVDEVKSDKTKVPEEFIFRSVLLDCFTAELDE